MKPYTAAISIALIALAFADVRGASQPSVGTASVYEAVLRLRVAPGAIIMARTIASDAITRDVARRLHVSTALLEKFKTLTNEPAIDLVPGRDLPAGSTVVSSGDLSAAKQRVHDENTSGLASMDWFERAYPGSNGLVTLSRVAIDPQAGVALLYMSHAIGPLNGYGALFVLRWRRGAWRIHREVQLWVS